MLIFETACQYILRHNSHVDQGDLIADFSELFNLLPHTAFLGIYATSPNDISQLHRDDIFSSHQDLRVRISAVIYGVVDWAKTLPSNDRRILYYACVYSTCSLLDNLSHFKEMSITDCEIQDEIRLLRFILALYTSNEGTRASSIVRDVKNTADICSWSSIVTSLVITNAQKILSDPARSPCSKASNAHPALKVDFQTPIKSCGDHRGILGTITALKNHNDEVADTTSVLGKVTYDKETPQLHKSNASEEKLSQEIGADNVLPSPPMLNSSPHLNFALDQKNSFDEDEALGSQEQAGRLESAYIWKSDEVSSKWNLPF